MATLLIHNGAMAGAMAALMLSRHEVSNAATPSGEAVRLTDVADAIAVQFLTANGLLTVPMADGDNADTFLVCFAAVFGQISGRAYTSTTPTDYAAEMAIAASFAKAANTNLT